MATTGRAERAGSAVKTWKPMRTASSCGMSNVAADQPVHHRLVVLGDEQHASRRATPVGAHVCPQRKQDGGEQVGTIGLVADELARLFGAERPRWQRRR